MNTERSKDAIVTGGPSLSERLRSLTGGSTDDNEVAAINLLATGIPLMLLTRGHDAMIEMLERAIAIVEVDREARLMEPIPIDAKPIHAKTCPTVQILGVRHRRALSGG